MEEITISSVADLLEAVRSHPGPAYVKIAMVESLRHAATVRDVLKPLVILDQLYGWSTGKLAAVEYACYVGRTLSQICNIVLPRLRVDITNGVNPRAGLAFLNDLATEAKLDAEFAFFSLFDDIDGLEKTVAAALVEFDLDGNVDALAATINQLEITIDNIMQTPFVFTEDTSSSSDGDEDDDGADDGGEDEDGADDGGEDEDGADDGGEDKDGDNNDK